MLIHPADHSRVWCRFFQCNLPFCKTWYGSIQTFEPARHFYMNASSYPDRDTCKLWPLKYFQRTHLNVAEVYCVCDPAIQLNGLGLEPLWYSIGYHTMTNCIVVRTLQQKEMQLSVFDHTAFGRCLSTASVMPANVVKLLWSSNPSECSNLSRSLARLELPVRAK